MVDPDLALPLRQINGQFPDGFIYDLHPAVPQQSLNLAMVNEPRINRKLNRPRSLLRCQVFLQWRDTIKRFIHRTRFYVQVIASLHFKRAAAPRAEMSGCGF